MAANQYPKDIFIQRIGQYKKSHAGRNEEFQRLAIFRLIIFIGTFIFVVYFANAKSLEGAAIAFGLGLTGFVLVQKAHNKTQFLRDYFFQLIGVNEKETLRLDLELSSLDDGQEFINANHIYTGDLGIFGHYSLYQLLNRTTTEFGKDTLAAWLQAPANKAVIGQRQESVRELSDELEWRQGLEALGAVSLNIENSIKDLVAWMQGPIFFRSKKRRRLTFMRMFITLMSFVALGYFFLNIKAFFISLVSPDNSEWLTYILPTLLVTTINFFILRKFSAMAEDIITKSQNSPSYLLGLKKLFYHLEKGKFQAELLSQLQKPFTSSTKPASELIYKLHNVLDLFHLRGTSKGISGIAIYQLLNSFFLLDIYCLVALDKWKEGYGKRLPVWVKSLGDLEALSSLAGFHFSNPAFVFPNITDKRQYLSFREAGHPLIPAQERVANDFVLTGPGDIGLITGSNMAGKSTFLRTLGINTVLALLGAPVCASKADLSELHVFTSMKTQDNLAAGVSSFYAELRRIKQLLDYVDGKKQVLFLLDEVLKGTNSTDKHRGTLSLLRQLSGLPASGLVTTHDLAIGKLLGDHEHISNYSFHSSIEDGKIAFDYKIKDGICQEFNASQLMKAMGINL